MPNNFKLAYQNLNIESIGGVITPEPDQYEV